MKKLIAVLLLAGVAQAGVVKFTAKHVVKPAAKATKKIAVVSGKGAIKAIKVSKKVLY